MVPFVLFFLAMALAPEIISPKDGTCFFLDKARGANFPLEVRNHPSAPPGHVGFRVVIIGIGQRLDQFLPADNGEMGVTKVPIALTGAGTYELTVSYEAAPGAPPTVTAPSSTVLVELSPPTALPVHPPTGWLARDQLERAAMAIDWGALTADADSQPSCSGGGDSERGRVRLIFVGDLRGVDGMKVVQLQQLRHLDRAHFALEYLDLTCDEGDHMPFLPELRAIEGLVIRRLCIRVAMTSDRFGAALRTLRAAHAFADLGAELRDALGELYTLLQGRASGPTAEGSSPSSSSSSYTPDTPNTSLPMRHADAIVLSNSAGTSDNYILDVARLAGVRVRLLDLGAKLIPNAGIDATGFVAPSHYVKQHKSVTAFPTVPVHVVSPAVDFGRFNSSAVAPCYEGNVRLGESVHEKGNGDDSDDEGDGDGPVIAYLGRLATEKSPGMFLRAALLLQKANPSVRPLMVGDGPLGGALRQVVARKRMKGARVHFLRTVGHARIACILKAVDVLVVPSVNTETFGLVGAEAMAMGVPVVSFGIGGVGEYMHHLRTAFLVNTTTPRGLATGIATVLRDRALGRRLAVEAQQHIRERFSIGPVVRRYSALYAWLAVEARRGEAREKQREKPILNAQQQQQQQQEQQSGARRRAAASECDRSHDSDRGASGRAAGAESRKSGEGQGDSDTLNIALHAQVSSKESGRVVGSEITCSGFSRALNALGHRTHTFYPFSYANLTDATWDIVLIEGWFEMFDAFVHEVRRLSPGVRVYFFCFDPAFPGPEALAHLDVDGYFTNSGKMLRWLRALAQPLRSEEIPLAADINTMKPWPHVVPQYAHNVTFVGAAGFEAKVNLSWMLREAAPFGLAIYGSAWDSSPEFAPYWRGILPKDHISQLYSSSKVVLGVTMDSQRDHGMVNNRVFEALACGAVFLSEHFPALEALFGDTMLYVRGPGDVHEQLNTMLEGTAARPPNGRELVQRKHTYAHRVAQILDFDAARPASDESDGGCGRRNCPKLAILAPPPSEDSFIIEHVFWKFSMRPALVQLASVYNVTVFDIDGIRDRGADVTLFSESDLLLVIDHWNGRAERFARAHLAHTLGHPPRSALLLWGSELPTVEDEARIYDVIFYRSTLDRDRMASVHPNLQHACGLDVEGLRSLVPAAHRLDTVCLAEQLSEKHVRFLTARSGQVLLVTRHGTLSEAVLQQLLAHNIEVVLDLTPDELVVTMRRAEQLLLLNCLPHTVEFAALVALALDVKVEMSQADAASARLTSLGLGWDLEQFDEQLRLGMSRLFCYGTARSDVIVRSPQHEASVSGILVLDFDILHFSVRKDGAACVFIDGKIEICLQQPQLRIALNLTLARAHALLTVSVGLVSNVYTGASFQWSITCALSAGTN